MFFGDATSGNLTVPIQTAVDAATTPWETGSSDVVEFGRGTFHLDMLVHKGVVELKGKGKHVTTLKWTGEGGIDGPNAGFIVPQCWQQNSNTAVRQVVIRDMCIDAESAAGAHKLYGAVFKNYFCVLENCIVRGASGSLVLFDSSGPGGTGAAAFYGGIVRNSQIGQSDVTADNGIEFRDPAALITDMRLYDVEVETMNHNGIVWSGPGWAGGLMMQGGSIWVSPDYSLDIRGPGRASNVVGINCAGNLRMTVVDPSLGVCKISTSTIGARAAVMFDPGPGSSPNDPLVGIFHNCNFDAAGYVVHHGTNANHTTLVKGGEVRVANPFQMAPGAQGRILYDRVWNILTQQYMSNI